ncbi:uncharacterized protein LOC110689984 isoform X2 [Chenopodium quinoa]|nr:uncharacterized protein LOC110689984 isoform X2 [Chenopodium quinoa]XP_021722495.1 uncharacterized protein LOC110689984 isoform X2 [Chenopodium quinoa]
MKLLFWKVAKSYNEADYNDSLKELSDANEEAAKAFTTYKPELFCRAFLSTTMRSDAITNNMAETFNGYIINARTKHLVYMLEDIRVALMERLVSKTKYMEKQTSTLCPRIQAILEKEKTKAACYDVSPSTNTLFNVRHNLDQLNVDLEAKTCTCRKWEMTGVPCCHVVACIFFLHKQPEDYADHWFTREDYLRSYAGNIPPCAGERHWPKVNMRLGPPAIKVGPGRPRKNRIKDLFEDKKKPGTLRRHGMEMTCSLCKVKGHNKRKFPNGGQIGSEVTEPAPKKVKGRPKKSTTTSLSQVASTCTPQAQPTPEHFTTTAHPAQIGRGGRMILGGQGSKGRGTGRGRATTKQGEGQTQAFQSKGKGRGRGRGSTQVIPSGVGVFITEDGTPMTNASGRRGSGRVLTSQSSQV